HRAVVLSPRVQPPRGGPWVDGWWKLREVVGHPPGNWSAIPVVSRRGVDSNVETRIAERRHQPPQSVPLCDGEVPGGGPAPTGVQQSAVLIEPGRRSPPLQIARFQQGRCGEIVVAGDLPVPARMTALAITIDDRRESLQVWRREDVKRCS